MKHHPKLLASLVGTALLAGCGTTPPAPQARVVPFSETRNGIDSADGYYALGRELQRSGKLDDAERAYRRALELDPAHIEAHNGLAAVSAGRGDVDMAISILTNLAAKRPDQAHLQGNLGYAHYLKGNYFEARVALERAIALDPTNARLQEKLAMVMQKLGPQAVAVPVAQADERTLQQPDAGMSAVRENIVEVSPGVHVLQRADAAPALATAPAKAPAAAVRSLLPEKGTAARAAVTDMVAEAGRYGRIEIVNGNGVAGMARMVHQRVQGGGDWQVVRLGNHPGFNVRLTRIEYARGNQQAARQLAKQLKIAPVYWHNDTLGDRVRVVLGHDLRQFSLRRTQAAFEAPFNAPFSAPDSAG